MAKKNIRDLFDATAFDKDGDKLGSVKQIFVDDNSGQPTFVEVSHGLFGMSSSIVPMKGHGFDGDELRLAFSKDRIKDAPSIDADTALSPEEQDRIYEHYALTGVADQVDYGTTTTTGAAGAGAAGAGVHADADRERVAADRERAADAGQGEIIRSEERMNIAKEEVATGKVGLRKYVVEDTETVEVPVRREEVAVEREPISAEEAEALKGKTGGIGEETASVTLHEERVAVSKEEVPVERVNLNKTVVEDTETVSETLRKERIETEGGIEEKK